MPGIATAPRMSVCPAIYQSKWPERNRENPHSTDSFKSTDKVAFRRQTGFPKRYLTVLTAHWGSSPVEVVTRHGSDREIPGV